MKPNSYRPDIDGLRALAILPVLLYHAGVPGFSGGFVGVDIFFVVSGFLITGILARELREGTFSIASFYERRIRRIFPTLLIVVAAVVLLSPFVLLPSEITTLPGEALSSLFFVANIALWRESGYFAAGAETKPLLHMWSLGVEEQFYLFCPLALWIIFKHAYRWRVSLVASGLILSLALCIWLTPRSPSASFYLIPTRAWELLAGSVLALVGLPCGSPGRTAPRSIFAIAGLIAIAISVHFYSRKTSFPGYAAILPVLGSALIIGFAPHTLVGRVLSLTPMTFIGKISYSLYLWHWPVMVFARALRLLDNPVGKFMAIVVSIALAHASFRLIETPTRNRQLLRPKRLVILTTTATASVALLGLAYPRLPLWESRLPPEIIAFDASRYDKSPMIKTCNYNAASGLPDLDKACVLGGRNEHLVVWGDSHGIELAYALGEMSIPVRQLTYSACFPALGWTSPPNLPDCPQHNKRVIDYLEGRPDIEYVVIAGFYDHGLQQDPDLLEKIESTVIRLIEAGKHVVIVGPHPYISRETNLPTHLAHGGERYISFRRSWVNDLKKLGLHALVVMPTDTLCEGERCDLLYTGFPILYDAHHPSIRTARLTAEAVKSAMDVDKVTAARARHRPTPTTDDAAL